jgi:hypothetical protein
VTPLQHNQALAEDAVTYVRRIAAKLGAVPTIAPRFTVNYTGFGTGGTAGVTAAAAIVYLRSISGPDDMHARLGKRITNIDVAVTVAPALFSA